MKIITKITTDPIFSKGMIPDTEIKVLDRYYQNDTWFYIVRHLTWNKTRDLTEDGLIELVKRNGNPRPIKEVLKDVLKIFKVK